MRSRRSFSPCRSRSIRVGNCNCAGPFQILGQCFVICSFKREIHHRVFVNFVSNSCFTEFLTEPCILFYGKTAVINKDNRLRILNTCRNFFYDGLLQFNFCHFLYLLIDLSGTDLHRNRFSLAFGLTMPKGVFISVHIKSPPLWSYPKTGGHKVIISKLFSSVGDSSYAGITAPTVFGMAIAFWNSLYYYTIKKGCCQESERILGSVFCRITIHALQLSN